ncbi:MAG: protein arginine kinase [Clostridiales bacterium]|nr:protein arginine kinase [Clostridiales bacterium]
MSGWITEKGPQNEIVLSSRIRLARNLKDTPFPIYLKEAQSDKVVDSVKSPFANTLNRDYYLYNMDKTDLLDKQILLERHLISKELVKSNSGAAIISKDDIISIMVNEEDHIRIQAILPGLQIMEAWKLADGIDNMLEEQLDYAYDEKLGYLTCCPTNVGTGMRASSMVHLPALNLTGSIGKILQTVTQIGLTIRGLYGEGTEILGNLFQISNQITLGPTEEEIIDNTNGVTNQIIEKEREARNILLNSNRIQLEDKILRSWGILRNAKIITSQECMKLLSDIRLGVDLDIIKGLSISTINEIMIDTQSAGISKYAKKELTAEVCDILRAQIIKEKLC